MFLQDKHVHGKLNAAGFVFDVLAGAGAGGLELGFHKKKTLVLFSLAAHKQLISISLVPGGIVF